MAQYRAAYQEFMTTVFDSGWFAAEMDRVRTMIDPYVQADSTAFCTYEEFQTGTKTLKAFCIKWAESVNHQLQGDDTRVDASELDMSVMGTMHHGRGQGGFGGWAGTMIVGAGRMPSSKMARRMRQPWRKVRLPTPDRSLAACLQCPSTSKPVPAKTGTGLRHAWPRLRQRWCLQCAIAQTAD